MNKLLGYFLFNYLKILEVLYLKLQKFMSCLYNNTLLPFDSLDHFDLKLQRITWET